jgi:hypothetical protein
MTRPAAALDSGLLAYASANLPRYTSYPTAPHLVACFDAYLAPTAARHSAAV